MPDAAGEVSFEAAECFASCLAFGLFSVDVVACGLVAAKLRDGDPVQCAVELSVSCAVESVPLLLTA